METHHYAGYTVHIPVDASYYGSNCTESDAQEIARSLERMICGEFPGITIEFYREIGPACTTGPDQSVILEIDAWISENWTAAL
jgi:hypothetical protein